LYQECTAVFYPVPDFSPWGGSIHHALACGKAIVAAENAQSDAMVGPAAYLIPPDDPRRLAAALITVVVEEEVRGRLESAARQRASEWQSDRFGSQLLALYRDISGR
jgi:glycosyltransferase involved in cell wall biosynthesis